MLKKDLGVTYQAIKRIPYRGNSTRCLALRQRFAQYMLGLLASGTRVINVDQTWIGDTNFTRRKWRQRGVSNSVAVSTVFPRVSMMLAISTVGEYYCSLYQVNTDSKMFCLFLSKLAERLTKEDRDWRANTVILCDGARYQTSKESQAHMRALGCRVVVTAPYSYASSPVEYAFAFFKSVDINPGRQKTGKK